MSSDKNSKLPKKLGEEAGFDIPDRNDSEKADGGRNKVELTSGKRKDNQTTNPPEVQRGTTRHTLGESQLDGGGGKERDIKRPGNSSGRKVIDKSGAETGKNSSKRGSSQGQKSDSSRGNNKENFVQKIWNNTMLVTDQYVERFSDKKPGKTSANSGNSKEDRALARLLESQAKADEKARQERARNKARAQAQPKVNPEDHALMAMVPTLPKPGDKDTGNAQRLNLAKEFEKQLKIEEEKRRVSFQKERAWAKKHNKVAPDTHQDVRRSVSYSKSSHNTSSDGINMWASPRFYEDDSDWSELPPPTKPYTLREPKTENYVTSKGQKVRLVEMVDFSGVFNVEKIEEGPERKKKIERNRKEKKYDSRLSRFALTPDKEKEKRDYNQLVEYNIPIRTGMMRGLLETDFYTHNFNGLIHQYYSHVLRSECFMNMQERYRGLDKNARCLTVIDIAKIQTERAELKRRRKNALETREKNLQYLRVAARDSLHFRFLKEMTTNQPFTIPITIMYSILAEATPVVESVWKTYESNLGKNHQCTQQAGRHYMRLSKRYQMYRRLGFVAQVSAP